MLLYQGAQGKEAKTKKTFSIKGFSDRVQMLSEGRVVHIRYGQILWEYRQFLFQKFVGVYFIKFQISTIDLDRNVCERAQYQSKRGF